MVASVSQTYRVAHRSFSVPSDPSMLWLLITPLDEPLLLGLTVVQV